MEEIENFIYIVKKLISSKKEYVIKLKTNGDNQYITINQELSNVPDTILNVSSIPREEICEIIYQAIITNVNPSPVFDFVSRKNENNKIRKDIFIEISRNLAFFINDKDGAYQEWINKMEKINSNDNIGKMLLKAQ